MSASDRISTPNVWLTPRVISKWRCIREEKFVEAVEKTVAANADWVPPYGSGASLYLRPYMFGVNPVIGVKPASEFQFRIFATPVGPYFKGGVKTAYLAYKRL